MFHLSFFGGALITGPQGRLGGRVAQRRQLALLAYLSCARRPVTRDRLLSVFWPESDTESARRALSDLVYVIRKALGDQSIQSAGDNLAVNPGQITSDVIRFEKALADDRYEEAVSIYTGPFLDGFHFADSAEFEEWLHAERDRLAQSVLKAAEAAAERRELSGERNAAVAWWRRASALEPENSRIALRLVQALAASGDRAGALRVAATHTRLLQTAYDTSPSAEFLSFAGALHDDAGGALPDAAAVETLADARAGNRDLAALIPLPATAEYSRAVVSRPSESPPRSVQRRTVAAVTGGLLLLALIAAWRAGPPGSGNVALDKQLVVTLPFRGSGLHPDLQYLRVGLAELIAFQLTGERGGLRAVPPYLVPGEHNVPLKEMPLEQAISHARRLSAGTLLTGSVVGVPASISIQVSFVDVATGSITGHAGVQGAEQELPSLVDRLVGEILSRSAGEEEHRLEHLLSTSLPALRTFLAARAAHRRGDYQQALALYGNALDIDSTFAAAGLGAVAVGGWVGGSAPTAGRGRRIATAHHDRLSARDRVGLFGRLRIERDEPITVRLRLREVDEALRRYPDHPRLWYLRGDLLMHSGSALGREGWAAEARESFERAIALDPDYAEPVHHLATTLGVLGDADALRRFANQQLGRLPAGPIADHLRWKAHHVIGRPFPSLALDSLHTDATLRWIGIEAQDYGFALDEGAEAVRLRLQRPGIRDQQLERRMGALAYALNGGRPAEAARVLASLVEVQPDAGFTHRIAILASLYADGDSTAAEAGAKVLASSTPRGAVGELNACVLTLWHLRVSPSSVVRPGILTDGEAVAADSRLWPVARRICALVRDAQWLAREGGDEFAAAIARLERLLATAPIMGLIDDGHEEYVHLALARLYERQGADDAARAALRRRNFYNGWQPYLASILEMEGRLAARSGDTATARRAYEHYLAFRREPEANLQTAAVRAALDGIVAR